MSKGGKIPGSGRKPKGYIKRVPAGFRMHPETVPILDAVAERIGNRSAAIDAIVDFVIVNELGNEVKPMGENRPRVSEAIELPPSMGFSTAAVRLLDRVMERLNLESQEDAVNAVCAFLRDRDMVDGILEAMAAKNE